jgi:transposase
MTTSDFDPQEQDKAQRLLSPEQDTPQQILSPDQDKPQRLPPLPGYIFYEVKGNYLYGRRFTSTFVRDGKVCHTSEFLGRVIDKDKGLFKNRERGYYTFSLENGYGEPDPLTVPSLAYEIPQRMSLNFGDVWMVDQIFKKTGLDEVLNNLIPNGGDALKSLVSFRLLEPHAYSFAEEWYRKSYANALYPGVNLESSEINKLHALLGKQETIDNFFISYLSLFSKNKTINNQYSTLIMIDSTGLPNDISTYLTNISNNNENISNEIRLIYVVDKMTKLPIFFNVTTGNIIDNSTLKSTINTLAAYNINIKLIVMDVDYYSMDNIEQLITSNISFITQMSKNRISYKKLMEKHGASLKSTNNLIRYGNRLLYGKKVTFELLDKQLYGYVILDHKKESEEVEYILNSFIDYSISEDKINDKLALAGRFIIVSSDDYDIKDILQLYYTRQTIEQVFDVSKNFADILPLRGYSAEIIMGRLLIAFIVTIVYSIISHRLSDSEICVDKAIYYMHNLGINIYKKISLLEIITKEQKEIFDLLSLDCPFAQETGNLLKNKPFHDKLTNGKAKKGGDLPKGSRHKTKSGVQKNLASNSEGSPSRGRPKGSKNKEPRREEAPTNNTDGNSK